MEKIGLDLSKATCFLGEGVVERFVPKVNDAQMALEQGTCAGNDYIGWLHLPLGITTVFLDEIQAVADTLREKCEVIVVAGIGGSYLGARAVIESLSNSFAWLHHPSPTTHLPSSFSRATTSAKTIFLNSRNT